MKLVAEKALMELGLDILTQQDLDKWYEDEIKIQPVSEVILPDWEDHHGYLSKPFYIKGEGDDFGVLRFAYFYPDGTIDRPDEQVLSIEKEY